MLVQTNMPIPQTMSNPRQIAIRANPLTGVVLYTVPTGRKFVGAIWGEKSSSTTIDVRVTVSGGTAQSVTAPSSYNTSLIPLATVLLSGTVLSGVSNVNTVMLLGVESDL